MTRGEPSFSLGARLGFVWFGSVRNRARARAYRWVGGVRSSSNQWHMVVSCRLPRLSIGSEREREL
jgi:hypothetical protein